MKRICLLLPPLAALATVAACSEDAPDKRRERDDDDVISWDGPPAKVALVENGPTKAQGLEIERLERASGEQVLFALDPAQGSPTTLYARVPGARGAGDTPAAAARAFLRSYPALFGDAVAELEDGPVTEDAEGAVVTLRRKHAGLRVADDDLTLHFAPDGALELVAGHLATDLHDVPTTASVTAESAINLARASLAGTDAYADADANADEPPTGTPNAELVYTSTSAATRLAWRVTFPDSSAEIRLDAQTGAVLRAHDGTRHASPTVLRARGVNGWDLPMNVLDEGSGPRRYLAHNRLLSQWTMECGADRACVGAAAPDAAGFKPEVASVHAYYAMAADTFRLDLLRQSGPPSRSGLVTVKSGGSGGPDEANWRYGFITLGQNSAGQIDTLGHEYTHGLIEATLNLTYAGQSGAIDESLADVFGLHVKAYACRMGWIPECGGKWRLGLYQGRPVRDLANPDRRAAREMRDPGCTNPSEPNSGRCHVHANSEIPSYAFYLAYEGGVNAATNKRVRAPIGEEARKIWYRAALDERRHTLRGGAPSFRDLAIATVAAADALHGRGSRESRAVACAWDAVDLSPTGAPACGGCAADGGAAPTSGPAPTGGVRTRSLRLRAAPSPGECSADGSAATPRSAPRLESDERVCSVASRRKARWHAFDARAGERTTFHLGDLVADLDLTIFDAAGRVLASSLAAGARDEEVTVVLAADARLYARVDAPNDLDESARYAIRVNGATAAARPPADDASDDESCTSAPRTCATGEVTCGAGEVCTATGTADRPFCCKREHEITQVCSSDAECPAGQVCGRAVLASDAGRFFTCSPIGTDACVR